MCINILRCLRDVFRRKYSRKMEKKVDFSWRQYSSTPDGFGQGCFSREQCDNTGASLIITRHGCCLFLPIPSIEVSIKGTALLWPTDVTKGWFTRSMPFPCRAHAVPLPCRAAKGLEWVFPIWFTQCGRVWFTLAMPCPCHAPTMPFFSRPQHSTAVERRPCCAVLCPWKNGILCVKPP